MSRAFVIAALVVTALASHAQAADDEPLYGFTPATSKTQRDWEKKFNAIPSPQIMRDTMQRLSARPHHVGSPYDKDNAEWILARFKSWGLDAHIEHYDVLFPTPKTRVVELIEPIRYAAKLQEPVVASDPTSDQQSEQLPSYNAYSIDGDVTAPLVYVNFGIPKDYETLERLGVSVKGRSSSPGTASRGGESNRRLPRSMERWDASSIPTLTRTAISTAIFPEGSHAPRERRAARQRHRHAAYPGDPLTPGVAAKSDAKRLSVNEAKTITKIPVLPISYGDAQPLLAALNGPVAPENWRGALPITYHVGPGPAKVHLVMKSNWDIKPIYDVIAKIPGSDTPDQWVIRGNHHDAWVNGAEDPLRHVAVLEEARALGELLKQGWKPKRTIIFCAWDGEEPGLLGSTEWVEDHADELKPHAALYINSDSNGRGFLAVGVAFSGKIRERRGSRHHRPREEHPCCQRA